MQGIVDHVFSEIETRIENVVTRGPACRSAIPRGHALLAHGVRDQRFKVLGPKGARPAAGYFKAHASQATGKKTHLVLR